MFALISTADCWQETYFFNTQGRGFLNHEINQHRDTIKQSSCDETKSSNSYTMGCPPVRGDNPRALASGLSYVQVDKHGITNL